MKSQPPALGIMKTGDWENSKAFRIACDCRHSDHDVNAWVELTNDPDDTSVDISFYVEGTTPFWNTGFSRIRAAWNMLIHGYHQEEHCLILRAQVAKNFITALDKSVKELEKMHDPRSN